MLISFEYIIINQIHDSIADASYQRLISSEEGKYGECVGGPVSSTSGPNFIGIIVGINNIWDATYEHEKKDYTPMLSWYGRQYFKLVKSYETLSLNGVTYNNVTELSNDGKIKKVFYAYKKGIIKYIDQNDKIWVKIK